MSLLSRRGWIIFLLLLTCGMALRIAWCLSRPVDQSVLAALPDQLEYLQAGGNLASGEGLWFTDPRFDQRIFASRTLGYPLVIAACGGSVRAIQIVQCTLDLLTATAVLLIARRWLSESRSLFASALVLFNPLLVYFTALVLTESLFVCLLACSVYLVLQKRTVLFGLILSAIAIHVRPSGLAMPLVLGAIAPALWPGRTWRDHLISSAAGVCMSILVLAPWAIRNQRVLGEQIWLTTNSGITLYDGVRPNATGASDQSFVEQMPELQGMNELERNRHFSKLANEQIAQDPLRIARLAVIKIARTWTPIPLSEQFSNPLYIAIGLLYTLPLLILTFVALLCGSLPRTAKLYLLLPAITLTVMHAWSVGSLRYRLPAEPMLCIIAASTPLPRRSA